MVTLQILRKQRGFRSAASLAERIGIPAATYTNYEQGRTDMPIDVACLVADALECSLDDLVGRVAPMRSHDSATITLTPEQIAAIRGGRP